MFLIAHSPPPPPLWRYNEGVHVVPDSLGYGGDSNSTMGGANHKHSLPSPEMIALSPGSSSMTQISETPPHNQGSCIIAASCHNLATGSGASPCAIRDPPSSDSGASPHNLDSTKYYSGGESSEGKTPNWRLRGAYAFAAALLDSTDEEEEREEEDILPGKDGGKGVAEKNSPRSEMDTLSTSTKGEPSTSTSISPLLHFDSGELNFLHALYMYMCLYHSLIGYPRSYMYCTWLYVHIAYCMRTAFDDHLYDRPRFAHSPINPRRPLTLSSPSHDTEKPFEV